MYEQQFGLKKRPFLAKATGNNVFVGPQTAKTMTGLKKALTSQDAVVVVSGPPGAGKTTLVAKSLDALSGTHKTVRIGRMHLEGTDVLEFLLEELGTTELPRGTIRQFTALREMLGQLEADGKHVVIAVEDAIRTGAETLAELEALTAADAGESGGAAIVLMGDGGLLEFLKEPQLARLGQRIRQRHTIEPLRAAELRGYLMHCFRLAGNDFEQVFDGRTAELVHELSGGIPRVANNLVESAMSSAATAGMERIPASFVANFAKEEFGLEANEFDATPPLAAPEPAAESVGVPVANPDTVLAADLEEPAEPEPEPEPEPAAKEAENPEPANPEPGEPAEPAVAFSDEVTDEAEFDDDDIPELIQDTLPDLQILAPEIVAAKAEEELPELTPEPGPEAVPELVFEAEPESVSELAPEPDPEPGFEAELGSIPELSPEPDPEPVFEAELGSVPELAPEPDPEPVFEAELESVPELSPEPDPEPVFDPVPESVLDIEPEPTKLSIDESSAADVPEWERDPTIAELRPDLDALEKAMAFAQSPATLEPETQAPVAAEPKKTAVAPAAPDEIPEITLDNAIQSRIANELIDEPGQISPNAPEALAQSTADSGIPEVKIAPRKAKKADAELERIAAELAKAKTIEEVDDKLAETLFGEELNFIAAQVVASPPSSGESANDDELALFDTAAAQMAQAAGAPALEVSLETPEQRGEAGLDIGASQRLKTVRALNADLDPSIREPKDTPPRTMTGEPSPSFDTPEPIEDQINTSMTQTLKALNVKPPISDRATQDPASDDEEREPKKSGFFSRFKRS